MSGDIGVEIQDDECVFRAVKYEVLLVVFGIGSDAAEDTTLCL